MTGKTHRVGGMLCAILGFLLLKWNGKLLSSVHPIIQLLIIYPFASWGSVASDLDHHWSSCPDKNVPNYIINKLLHITTPVYKRLNGTLTTQQKRNSSLYRFSKLMSANHRSWQTHSDLTFCLSLFVLFCSLKGNFYVFRLNEIETAILSLVTVGITLGLIAHFILDMLTTEGITLVIAVILNKLFNLHLPEKFGFVPKSHFFRTGDTWENLVRVVILKATYVVTVILIIELIYPNGSRIVFSYIGEVLSELWDWFSSYSITIQN